MVAQELIKIMRFLKYFLVLIIISSCKPTKDITRETTDSDNKRLNPKQVIRKVSKSKSKFKSFQSKIKIKLNNKGRTKSYSANIRIIKDKAIWLSSAAGIVRVLITKDSLFYYNKLQKNYLKSSFSNIDEILGVNLSYKTIESLLLSEPVNKINKSDFNDSFSGITFFVEEKYSNELKGFQSKTTNNGMENRHPNPAWHPPPPPP